MRSSPIQKYLQGFPILARIAALVVLCAVPGFTARAQQASQTYTTGISVEPSPQLFATLCALDAAGLDADVSTLAQMPARLALRDAMLKMDGPATHALREFYRDHALADPGETLSRYITFALVAGPPPRFQYLVDHDLLPPDVVSIDGFQEVLANFYREAHLDAQWASVEPDYLRATAIAQAPVRRIVTLTNAYLREIIKPTFGHTFTVYVEPLVGNRTNFRNYGNHYAIVIGAGSLFPTADIQHAYLHYMLDPFPIRYRKELDAKSALLEIAARAPRLPVEYRTDFLAFADECLIKAVELRLRKTTPAQLEASLQDADVAGFILVRPIVAQLQKFEKAEPAMSYYFPDLVHGIDVAAEQKRLKGFTFAAIETAPPPQPADAGASDQTSELDTWLAEGDHQIAARDVAAATETFEKILEKYPDEPRAIYGLAIVSVLSGKATLAKELFERLVSPPAATGPGAQKAAATTDPTILAWSHVYLGRIHDLELDRELAVNEYRAAIAVEGAPEAARVAAERGAENAYQPPRANEKETQKP
ncbi:MAG: hypothetical protein WBP79_10085 [Candidatus Acidiferrales bacterium]